MSRAFVPRGLRNCNPGTIRRSAVRYKGECDDADADGFRRFESMAYGYRAMFVLLHTYSVRYGCRSIADMIARYAPPSENDTSAYVRRVARAAGIEPHAAVDTRNGALMQRVVCAMSAVENGVPADVGEVRQGWEMFEQDMPK